MSAKLGWLAASVFALSVNPGNAASSVPNGTRTPAAERLCDVLFDAVAEQKGSGPAFVESYRPGPDEFALEGPLQTTAFVYDNALTAIALVGCGKVDAARRIGDALIAANTHDRSFTDGRIRNAYRAGPLTGMPVALPGWYDEEAKRWLEDQYQASTSTGNVAWAALALLRLKEATGDRNYLDGAKRLVGWIADETYGSAEPAGYRGGYSGFEPTPQAIRWKSTEHNIDVMAAAGWLASRDSDPRWKQVSDRARSFVDAMKTDGRGFQIGTTPENLPAGYANTVLDAQLWPAIAVIDAPASWVAALDVAKDKLGVDGGFDFNADRDGLWTEGTAQASLVFSLTGRAEAGARYLDVALAETDPKSGWLFASKNAKLTTGLSIGPAGGAPFLYFRRPHLGATAWATLAALRLDPFLPAAAQSNAANAEPRT